MRSNNNKKNRKTARKTTRRKKSHGGKAIDAGSYGCVFRPPLKCVDSTIPYNNKYVSKLMYKRDIGKEVIEMNKVKKIIEKIKDNENYFLVANTYTCNPDAIQGEDLDGFDQECELFTEEGITSQNVNDNLNQLAILNIPDGGLTIDTYIKKMVTMPKPEMYVYFIKLNKSLIKLLLNGIIPINENKLNHFDVKGNNILIEENGEKARLIDWGLAGENNGTTIPNEIENRSIHFNMPYSDIFFNSFIKLWLPEEFKRIKAAANFGNKTSGQPEFIKIIAVNLLNKVLSHSKGHFKSVIKHILHDIYKIYAIDNGYNTIDYNVLSYDTIIDYIQKVILNYADENGNFKDTKYFYEVFTKNADVWGFLMCYTKAIEHGVDITTGTYILDKDIINSICRILIKFCFSSEFSIKPIDIDELTKELESLNTIAEQLISKDTKNTKVAKNLNAIIRAAPKIKKPTGLKIKKPLVASSSLNFDNLRNMAVTT